MCVKINNIVEPVVKLYDSNDVEVGLITNYLQLNDVRLQIKRQKLEGYYVIFGEDYKISIYSDGSMSGWPDGFYDLIDKQLEEFLDWGKRSE